MRQKVVQLDRDTRLVRPRDGKSPNNPAPELSAPAIVSRKGGYATSWTSVALGDTNITVQLARELETAGPSAALFANPYYVCLRNFYVAPLPAGNDANDGTSPQSPWATLTKANVGRVAGDCVNLAPGTYKLTAEVTITSGGNASTPAGYVVYRSRRMGAAHLVAAARFNHMMRITTHHVMFDGIDFDGNNFMAGLCGFDVEQSPNYHHIWVMNSQVDGFGQSGIQENGSEWFWNLHNHVYSNACTVRVDWQGSGISHVVPAAVPNYTPSAMDNYWAPFHIVSAYNLVHDNYGQQGLYAGENTDGNGIIYDTFRSYAGQSLCLGNIAYHNGGKGIHVFRSGHETVANNTAYNNNWDTYNPGTWRAEISAVESVGSTFVNNIAWATRGPALPAAPMHRRWGMPQRMHDLPVSASSRKENSDTISPLDVADGVTNPLRIPPHICDVGPYDPGEINSRLLRLGTVFGSTSPGKHPDKASRHETTGAGFRPLYPAACT